jgi:hypothetical protein
MQPGNFQGCTCRIRVGEWSNEHMTTNTTAKGGGNNQNNVHQSFIKRGSEVTKAMNAFAIP